MLQFSEIDRRRAAAGIEQKTLARRAGLHPQSYSKLRRSTPRGPTEATLKRLTEALDALIAEKSVHGLSSGGDDASAIG